MKVARFKWENKIVNGVVEADEILSVSGNIFGEFEVGPVLCKVEDVHLLLPVEPTTIVGVGLNYEETLKAYNAPRRKEPMLFLRSPSSLVGHFESIIYPTVTNDFLCEGELAVVIKKRAKLVSESEAINYILGYTCGNDLTAVDVIEADGNFVRSKNCDTSCSLGPFISMGISADRLRIRTWINEKLRQDGYTSDMLFSVNEIISYISQFMTLCPGDVILTGTPGVGTALTVGDVVEVEVEGIGRLRNEVVTAR